LDVIYLHEQILQINVNEGLCFWKYFILLFIIYWSSI